MNMKIGSPSHPIEPQRREEREEGLRPSTTETPKTPLRALRLRGSKPQPRSFFTNSLVNPIEDKEHHRRGSVGDGTIDSHPGTGYSRRSQVLR
jgi:hypothetical protein